jgi:hypothetical protein
LQKEEKYRFPIYKVGGRLKTERIKRLVPLFEQRRILLPTSWHRTTADGTRDLVHDLIEDEYMAFPVPVHDDMLDALSRICDTDTHVKADEGTWKPKVIQLKWPDKKALPPKGLNWRPSDPGMGY